MTSFYYIYERFLAKITDDMYLELTPRDTLQDMRQLLIDAIPGFEFPRKRLDYVFPKEAMDAPEMIRDYFDGGDIVIDNNYTGDLDGEEIPEIEDGLVDGRDIEDMDKLLKEVFSPENTSYFNADLTDEEINILALLMEEAWINRQIASIEVTRMKYSGSDFKMTSQANHLSKLLSLKTEIRRMGFHMQRLYKRRRTTDDGYIISNWSVLGEVSALDD